MAQKKKGKILWNRVFFVLLVLFIVIWLIAVLISKPFNKEKKSYEKTPTESSSSVPDNTLNANYDYKAVNSSEIYSGELILVNNDIAYQVPEPTDLTNVLAYRSALTEVNFKVKDNTVNVQKVLMDNLNDMINDFVAETNEKNLSINSGFRDKDYQQTLYDDDLEKSGSTVSTLVALPGHSEHQTGYAVDFKVVLDSGVGQEYDGTGNFAWINENCYKYGIIQRYADDKKAITGIDDEAWHFRYVGQPHAYVMKQQNFCLEEYIKDLKNYSFTKDHLEITNFDETKYDIYYVPATEETTKIPVPKNNENYTISGNNVDGFIVTVKLPS